MLEKLRNNPRIVVVALIAAGVLAIAVAAGNNNTNQSTTPEAAVESGQSTEASKDDAAKTDETADDSTDSDAEAPTGTSAPESVVKSGIDNVDVRTEGGTYKTTVKNGNNQTVIVRKMVADYLTSKSENLSDEQKLYIETTIVSQLPPKDKIYTGEEVAVTEEVMTKTVDASKQLTQEQIKRWSAYL